MSEKFQVETSEHVKIDYQIASFGERLAAFLIDFVIFLITWLILSSLLNFIDFFRIFLSPNYFAFYGWVLFHFLSGVFFNGNTVGKNLIKLKIIRVDGEDLTPLDYFVRSIFFMIDLIMTAGTLGGLFILGTSRNQRLGGLATNTIVINNRFSTKFTLEQILKMDNLKTYALKYEGVNNLTEKDALIIKKSLTRSKKHTNDAHRKTLRQTAINTAAIIDFNEPIKDIKVFLSDVLKDYIILTR